MLVSKNRNVESLMELLVDTYVGVAQMWVWRRYGCGTDVGVT